METEARDKKRDVVDVPATAKSEKLEKSAATFLRICGPMKLE